MEVRLENLLDFPFRFTIDNVWWGSFIIWTMSLGFAISGQKVDVEYRVDLH